MIVLSIISCNNSDPNTRPSPLTIDSIIIGQNKLLVEYSSPSVRKRKIWGELEPYDQVWRTGANDATIVEIDSDISIGGKILEKGKYSFFTIPSRNSWTLIFNSEWKQWGAYDYDQTKDALRLAVEPTWLPDNQERLKIYFTEMDFILRWEYLKIAVPFEIVE